jgi:hypothetical protein
MLARNDALHEALNGVVRAAMGGPTAGMAMRDAVINQARMPERNPVAGVQAALQNRDRKRPAIGWRSARYRLGLSDRKWLLATNEFVRA